MKKKPVNYLDDYLFIALIKALCNKQVKLFMDICSQICFPINLDKTFLADTQTVFLGFLIDTIHQIVSIPCEKISRGVNMIQYTLDKKNKKIRIKQIEKICGFLNFLSRAIVPGRAFTRRMYARINKNLKPHHHVRIDEEFRHDLETWLVFLRHPSCYLHDFMDFTDDMGQAVDFYSDTSKNPMLGMGAKCQELWMFMQWEYEFIVQHDPSIEYLKLYALTAAVLVWLKCFKNSRITIFCDNQSVVAMINNTSSSCKNCMVLIRIIVLQSLLHNVRLFAQYIPSKENVISDLLSHLKFREFSILKDQLKLNDTPTPVSVDIWPMSKIWME